MAHQDSHRLRHGGAAELIQAHCLNGVKPVAGLGRVPAGTARTCSNGRTEILAIDLELQRHGADAVRLDVERYRSVDGLILERREDSQYRHETECCDGS